MSMYRFHIAWVDGSDGACGDATNIYNAGDLIPEYKKGNQNVTAWEFDCEDEEMAYLLGYKKAFFENWTAHDSVTIVEKITACPSCGCTDTEKLEAVHFDGNGGYQILCHNCHNSFWDVAPKVAPEEIRKSS